MIPASEDAWPVTVDEAVDRLIAGLSEIDRQTVMNTNKDDLILFHHGWGTGIRNDFGLWRGNDALIESACGSPCHPDDASMIIVEAVWTRLNAKR